MQLDTLKNAGLTDGEIKIYEVLLNQGGLFAGQIIKSTGIKRGDCYNKIYDLVGKGLITESEKNKKKYFELSSPETVESYLEKQVEVLESTQKEVKSILPNLISTYNLAYHKPGVKFFEGEEGMRKIMEDSLTAESAIDSYSDIEAVDQFLGKINKDYVKKREKLKKAKRLIIEDTAYNRKVFGKLDPKTSNVRFIKNFKGRFSAAMQIYDNKVSYLTLKPETMMGIIIEDKIIADMHRKLFEVMWDLSGAH